jgi:hypothetical protein
MQRFLLRNFEIVAIIDSEVERFFPAASVNTTIVIARKQREEDARNANTVKFIYLISPLSEIIKKFRGVNNLYNAINSADKNEVTDFFRLNCIKQQSLTKFTKWGQFLKAPQIYFDLMEKGEKYFAPLKNQADVKYGIKTGCNDFFILKDITQKADDKQLQSVVNNIKNLSTIDQVEEEDLRLMKNGFNELWLIEGKFLFPMLTSPKDVKSYIVDSSTLHYKLLSSDIGKNELRNNYPYLYEYIKFGEKKNINRNSSIATRKIWYSCGEKQLPDLSFSYMINDFGKTYMGEIYAIDNFQTLFVKENKWSLFLFLNSTISWFLQQLLIRTNFGDGVGKIQSYEFADMLVANVDLEYLKVNLGETKNYKEELGTLENLNTANPERVKLDRAILNAIGYHNETERDELLIEIYRATFQLINARLQKAQSQKSVKAQRSKVAFTVYVEQLKEMLIEGKYEAKNTFRFAKNLEKLVHEISSESKLQKKILDAYWKEKFGELFNEEKIASNEQTKLF